MYLPHLRCTLTGFERNREIKILSKQINQKRLYSTKEAPTHNNLSVENLLEVNKHTLLSEPWFVTGFADAEGCFTITIRKDPRNNTGWQLEACFIINLHKKEGRLLKLIQAYFGGIGRIGKERSNCSDFTVSSLKQLLTVIIPHFDKYPLITQS